MEPQATTTTARPRLSADRLALAASVCASAGAGLFFLFLLFADMPCRYVHIAGDILDVGFQVTLGMAYLAAPLIGVLACVQLLRQRRTLANLDDLGILRTARRRFGQAALLFGIESLLVLLFWPGGAAEIDDPRLARLADLWIVLPGLLAGVLGIASFRLIARSREGGFARVGSISAITMGLGTTVLPWSIMAIPFIVSSATYSARSPAFCGDSSSLGQTVIVPTLDSAMPTGKNVIWCSSFQLAWDELRDNIVCEPVRLTGEQDLADRLNAVGLSKDDVDPSSYLAVAGTVGGGVLENVKEQMTHKFPDASVPAYDNLTSAACVMFAYLETRAEFKHPFENDPSGMQFIDSIGRETAVASFGVWEDTDRYEKVRDQVRVLWSTSAEPDPNQASDDPNGILRTYMRAQWTQPEGFAIDLCRYTEPYQIILARIEPKATLALTVADLNKKIADLSQSEDREFQQELSESDRLYIPEMFWEIRHRFSELEGQKLANPAFAGSPIELAEQMIHFRLDRCGVILKSRASLIVTLGGSLPRTFAFDKPFLICMRKRGCERPFFVMWVDNAELMKKCDGRGGR